MKYVVSVRRQEKERGREEWANLMNYVYSVVVELECISSRLSSSFQRLR